MTFFGLKLGQDLEIWAARAHQKLPGVNPPELRSHLHFIYIYIYIYNQLIREYYDLNTQLNKNITSEDEGENKMKVSIFESEPKLFSV